MSVTAGWPEIPREHMFDEIPISTIELSKRPFQTFPDITLLKKLIRKSQLPQNNIKQALVYMYHIICEIKRHRLAKVGYCYLGTKKYDIEAENDWNCDCDGLLQHSF